MKSNNAEVGIARWVGAVCAITIALSVGFIAHYEFAISLHEICMAGAIGVSTIGALLAIEYFGRKLRKHK